MPPECRPLNPMSLSPIRWVIIPGQHCWCCISLHLLSTKYGTSCILLGTVRCTRVFLILGHFHLACSREGKGRYLHPGCQPVHQHLDPCSKRPIDRPVAPLLIGANFQQIAFQNFLRKSSTTTTPPPTKCHQTNQDQSDVGRRTWPCYSDISLHSSTLHYCLSISLRSFTRLQLH